MESTDRERLSSRDSAMGLHNERQAYLLHYGSCMASDGVGSDGTQLYSLDLF